MPLAIKAALPSSTQTVTGASGTGSVATLSFAGPYTAPLGSTIIVTGVSTAGYNGTYVVTASSSTSVSYANTTTGGASGGSVYNIAPGGSVTLAATNTASDYTLTLPAATGTVALTASPTFTGTVTATTITSPSATALTIQSAGTTAMTVNTSQNVGIGTTSPNAKLEVYGQRVRINAAADPGVELANTTTVKGYMFYDTTNDLVTLRHATTVTGASIDSSGNLLVGTTTITSGRINTVSANGLYGMVVRDVQNNGAMILFQNNAGTTVGQITSNSTNTAYQTSSDYRLKENVQPMTGALEKISALKPVTYDWKVDGSDGEGFIAHELQSVIPHSVFGEKDAVNKDGSIKPQGVDYSKIVVHLVAAIQELSAKNDALEARLAALSAQIAAFTPAQ